MQCVARCGGEVCSVLLGGVEKCILQDLHAITCINMGVGVVLYPMWTWI